MTPVFLKNALYFGYSFYKKIEPYQFEISASIIISKVAWIFSQNSKWKKEIQALSKQTKFMKSLRSRYDDQAPEAFAIDHEIVHMQESLKAKKRQLRLQQLTWAQVPSLFFPLAFFNLWNTGHQMISRGVNLRHRFNANQNFFEAPLKEKVLLTAGFISTLGISASFCRQTGLASPQNRLNNALISLSIGISAVEIMSMIIPFIAQKFSRRI